MLVFFFFLTLGIENQKSAARPGLKSKNHPMAPAALGAVWEVMGKAEECRRGSS